MRMPSRTLLTAGGLLLMGVACFLVGCGDEGGSTGSMGADRQTESTISMPDPDAGSTPSSTPISQPENPGQPQRETSQ